MNRLRYRHIDPIAPSRVEASVGATHELAMLLSLFGFESLDRSHLSRGEAFRWRNCGVTELARRSPAIVQRAGAGWTFKNHGYGYGAFFG